MTRGYLIGIPGDAKVGETSEQYRLRKLCPFNIPLMRYSNRTDTTAEIQTLTTERVSGLLNYGELYKENNRTFDVKHDGKKFSIGSGSSKQTFYFNNRDAK